VSNPETPLAGRAVDRAAQGRRVVGHGDRVAALDPDLHHAAFVIGANFAAVFVAQVDFHPGDALAKMPHGALDDASHVSGELFTTIDVVVGVDLNLHSVLRRGSVTRG
jgi:hypothetical protein